MATQERSSATQARILDAARALFLERNFADVTMEQVAATAQATKGAVYHHFASKEELYLAMLHADLEDKRELFQRAVDMPGNCRERLRRLTSDYFHLPRGHREIISLVRRDVNVFEGDARTSLIRAYQSALPEQVEKILCDGVEAKQIEAADPRLLSWSFVALVEVSLSPHAGRVFPGGEAKLDHILNLFFDGASTAVVPN
ncbi:MAG: TetR/AcrR family transcriptional regulator [Planctomycetota bacterium]|jgi:AcrR family transcriptional regulator|nr:TetR/AcrR family transcriptional regulator [Planctomycetota bacterium]MDP6941614.1 TetR/AcrR family transcriptional regulator [Planctomycetota bacterium]